MHPIPAPVHETLRCDQSCGRIAAMEFWQRLDTLANRCAVIVDRPKGSAHPGYPSLVYPLDYGYLEGTRSADGGGIDMWVGSLGQRVVTGILCTVDLRKGDAEIKILLDCTEDEAAQALAAHSRGEQSGLLILRSRGPAFEGAADQVEGDKR